MALNFLTHIFGSRNERLLKQYRKTVAQINALEPTLEKLSDEALRAKTDEFKSRVANGETLDVLLPEAYAVVREASKRVMKMRHFDVQMLGGISLHHGKISEMRTGEGKTLTATLPVYLNALTGNGVHVVTVNDYLASRDAQLHLVEVPCAQPVEHVRLFPEAGDADIIGRLAAVAVIEALTFQLDPRCRIRGSAIGLAGIDAHQRAAQRGIGNAKFLGLGLAHGIER